MIRGKPEGCKLIKDRNLHGDPANKVRDRRLRAVLVEKGWKPLVISAQGLKDAEQFNAFLETLKAAIECQ
ncbi:MAG: hypothetical protein KAW14_03190 [Candidatus Aegiribacteria sp.]|nr:hypothetical protein [Candidatus Aegiribacteria sp.]